MHRGSVVYRSVCVFHGCNSCSHLATDGPPRSVKRQRCCCCGLAIFFTTMTSIRPPCNYDVVDYWLDLIWPNLARLGSASQNTKPRNRERAHCSNIIIRSQLQRQPRPQRENRQRSMEPTVMAVGRSATTNGWLSFVGRGVGLQLLMFSVPSSMSLVVQLQRLEPS